MLPGEIVLPAEIGVFNALGGELALSADHTHSDTGQGQKHNQNGGDEEGTLPGFLLLGLLGGQLFSFFLLPGQPFGFCSLEGSDPGLFFLTVLFHDSGMNGFGIQGVIQRFKDAAAAAAGTFVSQVGLTAGAQE